jgi:uncharacterized membrane protein YgaE (UPF0421/DUF939 family)
MDSMILYPSIGIVILILVIIVTLNYDAGKVKTKEEKRAEILQKYKEELHSALSNIDDNEEKKEKKAQLLKRFNNELSRNIFFDADEIRDVITRLTKI